MPSSYQAPLTVHICWSEDHASSCELFAKVATALHEFLCRPLKANLASDPGVGIPVRIGSDPFHVASLLRETRDNPLPDDLAPRVVAITLLNSASNGDEAFLTAMDQWWEIFEKRGTKDRILVLPVVLDRSAPMPGDIPPCRGAAYETDAKKKLTSVIFEVSTAISHFLMRGNEAQHRRVKIFVSHAKADLVPTAHFASELRNYISQTQLKAFFDANDVESGGNEVSKQLELAQKEAVFLSLRGDGYSDSPYCLEEVLTAKKYGVPIVCVHAFSKSERRSLAYGGNAYTYVRRSYPDGPDEDLEVITKCCLQAWVGHLYFHFAAPRVFRTLGVPLSPRYLSRSPELIDFAHSSAFRDSATLIFHPDPPLPQAELAVIQSAYPKVRFATPTTLHRQLLRRVASPLLDGVRVALSLSDSPDLRNMSKLCESLLSPPRPAPAGANDGAAGGKVSPRQQGLTSEHRREAAAYLTLTLIKAGAALGYGGSLDVGGDTVLLSDLVEVYKRTTKSSKDRLFSYLAAHMWNLDASESVRARFLRCRLEKPSLFPKQITNALELAVMRKRMAKECGYRVIMGGKTHSKEITGDSSGYSGRLPGQAEEAYRHMTEGGNEGGKPIYVVAGFGGCARMVADALCGKIDHLPTDESEGLKVGRYLEFTRAYDLAAQEQGEPPMGLKELWAFFAAKGEGHFYGEGSREEEMWVNGLTVADNRRLFESVNPDEISSLILTGIVECRKKERKEGLTPLKIVLFHGSITEVPNVDSYAVPVLAGASLRGADGALDTAMNGAIRLHLEELGRFPNPPRTSMVPIAGGQLPGDYVILQNIGDIVEARRESEKEQLEWLRGKVRVGMVELSKEVQRLGLASPALVPFGSTLGLSVRDSVLAIVEGLLDAKASHLLDSVAICERDGWCYEQLLKLKNEIQPPEDGKSGEPHPLAGKVLFTELRPEKSVFDEKAPRVAILLQIRGTGNQLRVEVTSPGRGTSVAAETKAVDWQKIQQLAHGYSSFKSPPSFPFQETIGAELTKMVLPEAARLALLRNPDTPVDIVHDLESAAIPFELLCLPEGDKGGGAPLLPAVRGGIRRRLFINDTENRKQAHFRIHTRVMFLRVLVVADSKNDLPQAKLEAEKLIADFSKRHDVVIRSLVGKEATKDAVVKWLQKESFDVLHFAGHGQFDAMNPSNSGIVLKDGLLQASDFLNHQLTSLPALVILNACEAARLRGEEDSSPGLAAPQAPDASLAETIIRAGIGGFIGNMWRVGDQSAAEFSATLYAGLGCGLSLGEAFLQARRKLFDVKNPDWSNYIFYGDPDLRI